MVVNPLAGEEHLKEVIQQLQLMGEVVYLKSDQTDLIVLQPKWLCGVLCGSLLSPEFHQTSNNSGEWLNDLLRGLFGFSLHSIDL